MGKRCRWIIAVAIAMFLLTSATALAGSRWDHRLLRLVPIRVMQNLALQDLSGDLLLESGDKLIGENQ